MEWNRFLNRFDFHRVVFFIRVTLWLVAALSATSYGYSVYAWVGVAAVLASGTVVWRRHKGIAVINKIWIPVEFLSLSLAVALSGGLQSPFFLFYGGEAIFLTAYGTIKWSGLGALLFTGLYGLATDGWMQGVFWYRVVIIAVFFVSAGLLGEAFQMTSRSVHESQRTFNQLSRLKVLQESMMNERRLDVVVSLLLRHSLELVGADLALAAVVPKGGRLTPIALLGEGLTLSGWTERLQELLEKEEIPHVLTIRRNGSPGSLLAEELFSLGIHSVAICPLYEENQLLGVLGFGSRKTEGQTLERQHLVIQAAADIMQTQIQFHRQREIADKRGRLLSTLERVGRLLNRNLDMGHLLQTLHQAVAQELETDSFFVALTLPNDPGHALMRYLFDDGEEYPEQVLPLDPGGVTAEVMATGTPRLVNGVRDHVQLMGSMREPKGMMVVPLIYEGRVIGALSAQSYRTEYDGEHLEFLSAVASQAAVAIRNAQLYQQTQEVALTDHLTGLGNSRQFNLTLQHQIELAEQTGQSLSLLLLDSDSLKAINDRLGHMAGDAHLQMLAQVIKSCIRDGDTACRYAGDEFVVILPTSRLEDALLVGERIRETMDKSFNWEGRSTVAATISVGVAEFVPGMTADQLFAQADRAMYLAKRQGKNRVVAS